MILHDYTDIYALENFNYLVKVIEIDIVINWSYSYVFYISWIIDKIIENIAIGCIEDDVKIIDIM